VPKELSGEESTMNDEPCEQDLIGRDKRKGDIENEDC
jgi:hypothetical protein